jgi:hypothetical protein
MKGARSEHDCSRGLQKGAQPGVPHAGQVGWEADDRLSWAPLGWIIVGHVFLLALAVWLTS